MPSDNEADVAGGSPAATKQDLAKEECEKPKTRAISPIQWDIDEKKESARRERRTSPLMISSVIDSSKRLEPLINLPSSKSSDSDCYFLIKSNNSENIEIAMEEDVWSTPLSNQDRFLRALRNHRNIYVFFSIRESGRFQGVAKILAPPDESKRVRWYLPRGMRQSALSDPFPLEWLHKKDLPFSATTHLTNSWNEDKPVKIGRDGQEIEPECGRKLCELFQTESVASSVCSSRNREPFGDSTSDRRGAHNRLGERSYSKRDNSESYRRSRYGDRARRHEEPRPSERLDPVVEAAVRFNQAQAMLRAPVQANPSLAAGLMAFQMAAVASVPPVPPLLAPTRSPSPEPRSRYSQSRYRRHSRTRSRSVSPYDRLKDLDYEEYLRQASRGIHLLPQSTSSLLSSDPGYDARVEKFLRGVTRSPRHRRDRGRSGSSDSSGHEHYRSRRR